MHTMIKDSEKEQEIMLEKYNSLISNLKSFHKAAVAFSGGVDSTFLLKAAKVALGENVIALIAVSPVLTKREEQEAEAFLNKEQIAYRKIEFGVFGMKEFAENPNNRCYYCKGALMKRMKEEAESLGISSILEGSNVDDEADYRPGLQALKEQEIISPLRVCRFTKKEIRELSKQLKLTTWNKPSMACLASRVPYGTRITKELLHQIEQGEEFLKEHGFTQVRVRVYTKDMLVRLEVLESDLSNVLNEAFRTELIAYFKQLGFRYITLDVEGFRSGSMNIE